VGLQAEQSIIEISLITGFVPVETTLSNLAVADVVDGTGNTITSLAGRGYLCICGRFKLSSPC